MEKFTTKNEDENLLIAKTRVDTVCILETQMALRLCHLSRRKRNAGTDSQTPNTLDETRQDLSLMQAKFCLLLIRTVQYMYLFYVLQ